MLLNEDYRSRAIGIAAALGILVTGIVVERASTPVPPTQPSMVVVEAKVDPRATIGSRLQTRCDPFC